MGALLATSALSASGEHDAAAVLLVAADAKLARELLGQLGADGYLALHASTASHASALACNHRIRALLLGALDTRRGALELLAHIRHGDAPQGCTDASPWEERLPAIVLGGSAEPLELLRAFEAGADDFIVCPPVYLELRARLKALLGRTERPRYERLMRIGALEIDQRARLARVAASPVALTHLEYELLLQLARDPHRVCSKQELLRVIWGREAHRGGRTLDSHASRLRRKLEAAGAPGLVVNVWATGYRLT